MPPACTLKYILCSEIIPAYCEGKISLFKPVTLSLWICRELLNSTIHFDILRRASRKIDIVKSFKHCQDPNFYFSVSGLVRDFVIFFLCYIKNEIL